MCCTCRFNSASPRFSIFSASRFKWKPNSVPSRHIISSSFIARMRLSHLPSTAARIYTYTSSRLTKAPAPHYINQFLRWQSTSQPPSLYPPQLRDSIKRIYSDEFVKLYKNHIAGRARYNPFEAAHCREYPCIEDYRKDSPFAQDVICQDVSLQRKTTGNITLRYIFYLTFSDF